MTSRPAAHAEVPPDTETLAQIAEMTGGTAFDAPTAKDLSAVYDNLQSRVGYIDERQEVTSWFAAAALVLVVVGAGPVRALVRPAALAPGRRGPARSHAGGVTPEERRDFIVRNTTPGTAPFVPEITLLVGGARDAAVGQAALADARPAVPPPYWAWPWAGGQALARLRARPPGDRRGGRRVADIGAGGGDRRHRRGTRRVRAR